MMAAYSKPGQQPDYSLRGLVAVLLCTPSVFFLAIVALDPLWGSLLGPPGEFRRNVGLVAWLGAAASPLTVSLAVIVAAPVVRFGAPTWRFVTLAACLASIAGATYFWAPLLMPVNMK